MYIYIYIYIYNVCIYIYIYIYNVCCFCIVSVWNPGGVFVGNLLEVTSPLMLFENFMTLILFNKLIYYLYQ